MSEKSGRILRGYSATRVIEITRYCSCSEQTIKQSLQCTKFGSRSMFGRFSCVLDLGALITLPSCCNTCERFQITGEQRLSSHCNCNSGNMKQKCFSFQQNLQVSFSQLNLFCEISDFRDNVLISCVNFFINFS